VFADAATVMREEAAALARLGCTYVQIDAPDLGTLGGPENRELRESLGMPTEGVDIINSLRGPGTARPVHPVRLASVSIGANLISADIQQRKLELVGEVARQVWQPGDWAGPKRDYDRPNSPDPPGRPSVLADKPNIRGITGTPRHSTMLGHAAPGSVAGPWLSLL
jgi:hypothetical protein